MSNDMLRKAWENKEIDTWVELRKSFHPDIIARDMSMWNIVTTKHINGFSDAIDTISKTEYGWCTKKGKLHYGRHGKVIDLEFYQKHKNSIVTWSDVYNGILVKY